MAEAHERLRVWKRVVKPRPNPWTNVTLEKIAPGSVVGTPLVGLLRRQNQILDDAKNELLESVPLIGLMREEDAEDNAEFDMAAWREVDGSH